MRKNKTDLTAHHFMSVPGDSLSYSFPIYFVCFVGKTPSKCISWSLPTFLFFLFFFLSLLWPVTDTSVQSINLTLPYSETTPFFFLHPRPTHRWHHVQISEAVTLNGINIWCGERKTRGQINLLCCLANTDPLS